MAHYFSNDKDLKSNRKQVTIDINNIALTLYTDHGVFNKGYLDLGTKILLNTVILDAHQKVLDLGCGSGIIGMYLNKQYNACVDMVDINQRAVNLAKDNIACNDLDLNVFQSDGFEHIDALYDVVILNPPIHAGKLVVYQLFEETANHLKPDGLFYVVIHKKHGAKSALKKLNSIFNEVRIITREKGFFVISGKID
ncbi:MAG: methyltransferase [Candidatus Izimaplasma sp.]|nr:methyltransferase [Candidatus Izimaplasma bacterium]